MSDQAGTTLACLFILVGAAVGWYVTRRQPPASRRWGGLAGGLVGLLVFAALVVGSLVFG